ncbi:trigger factor [Helicobacter saguini]|uniref:Trigger factor n=1 Tax=Helicobacter saguini TaxID=1548018 RepID=A0A6L7DK12_9HELI|nr:trigger factor [Helicobacter saguini]MWV61524.1 trigger factor [Helicobacter saguini]MWV67806.1 trigger factor [Helicobacter saguini]MWV70726.1 trigger factor [Helicobacter saguini]MWV72629.1 trigger factor [Helicobacter saguini]
METKRVDDANASASGKISTETINNHIEKLANSYAKNMKIDGFRRGKVPVSVVKNRYKDNLEQEARQKSIDNFFESALKDLGIDSKNVIGQPLITKFDESDKGIDIEMKIGLSPSFELKDIESCVPSFTLSPVDSSAVDKRLDDIAKSRAPIIESKATSLDSDLIGNIDFEGFIDGVAFQGGKAEGFDLLIGSGQFIPGFEDSIKGMKVGESREIKVTFPKEYQNANLAGKDATFKVKLNAIKEKGKVKIDDSFAKSLLGDKDENTLEKLKENIKKELENEERLKLYNEKLKEETLENIAKTYNFALPENIIEQEINVLVNNAAGQMSKDELESLRGNESKIKELRDKERPNAEKSVKVTFIIDKLAKEQKIHVDDNEVYQALYYESMMNGQNPQEVIEMYRKNNLLPAVKMAMIEERVITHLLDSKNGLLESKEDSKK